MFKFKIDQQIVIGSSGGRTAYTIKGKTNMKITDCRKAYEGSLNKGCTACSLTRELPFGITFEVAPYFILTLNTNGSFILTGIPQGSPKEFVTEVFENIIQRGENA